MKTILKKLLGCNSKQKPTDKPRKFSNVGMTKKDWQREDNYLKWVEKQIALCYMPAKKIQGQKIPKIEHPQDETYKILSLIH